MKQLIILSRDYATAATTNDEYTQIWKQVLNSSHTKLDISNDRKVIVLNGPFVKGSYTEDDGDFISAYLRNTFPDIITSINSDCETGIIYHSHSLNLKEGNFTDFLFFNKISFIERLSSTDTIFYPLFLEQTAILIGQSADLKNLAFDALWQYNEKKKEKIERLKTDFLYLIYNGKYPGIIPEVIIQTKGIEDLSLWFKDNPYNKQLDIDGIESPTAEEQRKKLCLLRDTLLASK